MAGYHSALIAGWVPCGIGFSFSERSLEILGGIQIPCLSLAAFKEKWPRLSEQFYPER